MAFDGAFLHKITGELKSAADSHIDKIYQPSKDELVLLLRKKGFSKRLLITVKQGFARIHFTEAQYENPAVPPMFCMLLRKHLSSARLTDITQPGLERVAELIFSASNDMGDSVTLRLICEFTGNKTNIILVGENGKIIDSLRRSDPETGERMILPGAEYTYPPPTGKLDPTKSGAQKLSENIMLSSGDRTKALLNTADGFSPLICREVIYKSGFNESGDISAFTSAVNTVLNDIKSGGKPIMLADSDGVPFDFSYTDISQYGNKFQKRYFNSYSELLDGFYTAKDNADRIRRSAADIIKLVNNLYSRTEKKLALRLNDLKKCQNRETLRIYGELLKANLHSIPNGSRFAEVVNYYDDELKTVRIPLNPAVSPQNNAAKYFKDYKKTYTAEQTLTELTKKDREELLYFETVLDSIARSTTLAEIAEIREELTNAGYTKKSATVRRQKNTKPQFCEYISEEGYKILVGKNNTQNDYLTTVLATKNDMWFHVKNIPGSHVIVFCGGNELSESTVLYAAGLAAANSKAAASSNVAVDFTPVKYVKKPNGAKPGMVIYTTNKTVYVTPEKGENL